MGTNHKAWTLQVSNLKTVGRRMTEDRERSGVPWVRLGGKGSVYRAELEV